MHLGLMLSAQHPRGDDLVARFREHLEQVAFAREAGFRSIVAGQHFLATGLEMLQPTPLLARVAAEAGETRLVHGILLLALLNPVEVAETAATMDVINGGRYVLGVGLGYRPEEFAAFGVDPKRRVSVFLEKLATVRALLGGEPMTASGPGYSLRDAVLSLRPASRHIPIWLAANSDRMVERAAMLADTWLGNPHATLATCIRQVALFRARRAAARLPPATELPLMREACIAPTDEEAFERARPYLEPKYANYVRWGQHKALPADDNIAADWGDLVRDRFLIGSPATCTATLRRLEESTGATECIVRVHWAGMPHGVAMETLRLLAEEVRPGLQPGPAGVG